MSLNSSTNGSVLEIKCSDGFCQRFVTMDEAQCGSDSCTAFSSLQVSKQDSF